MQLVSRRHSLKLALALLASTRLPTATAYTQKLTPFRADYSIGNHLIVAGSASFHLTQEPANAQIDHDHWQFMMTTRPTGLFKASGRGRVTETSLFTTVDHNIRPFQYQFIGQKKEAEDNALSIINWENQYIDITDTQGKHRLNFSSPIVDRISATLEIARQLRSGKLITPRLQVLDRNQLRMYQFKQGETVVLDTEIGRLEAIMIHQSRQGSSRSSVTWLSSQHNYLPIQIEQHRKGKLVARVKIKELMAS